MPSGGMKKVISPQIRTSRTVTFVHYNLTLVGVHTHVIIDITLETVLVCSSRVMVGVHAHVTLTMEAALLFNHGGSAPSKVRVTRACTPTRILLGVYVNKNHPSLHTLT